MTNSGSLRKTPIPNAYSDSRPSVPSADKLGIFCTFSSLVNDEQFIRQHARQARRLNAVYRLTFRQPSRMQLDDDELSLAVDYIHELLDNTLISADAGKLPRHHWEYAIESTTRLHRWTKQQGREEL